MAGRENKSEKKKTSSCELTHDVALVLAVVKLRAADLHLHKGADDATAILRKVPGTQDLERGRSKKHKLKGNCQGAAIFRLIIFNLASLPAEVSI